MVKQRIFDIYGTRGRLAVELTELEEALSLHSEDCEVKKRLYRGYQMLVELCSEGALYGGYAMSLPNASSVVGKMSPEDEKKEKEQLDYFIEDCKMDPFNPNNWKTGGGLGLAYLPQTLKYKKMNWKIASEPQVNYLSYCHQMSRSDKRKFIAEAIRWSEILLDENRNLDDYGIRRELRELYDAFLTPNEEKMTKEVAAIYKKVVDDLDKDAEFFHEMFTA